jgi:hypothetical protein
MFSVVFSFFFYFQMKSKIFFNGHFLITEEQDKGEYVIKKLTDFFLNLLYSNLFT